MSALHVTAPSVETFPQKEKKIRCFQDKILILRLPKQIATFSPHVRDIIGLCILADLMYSEGWLMTFLQVDVLFQQISDSNAVIVHIALNVLKCHYFSQMVEFLEH